MAEHRCVQSDGVETDDEWTTCNGGWLYGPCEDPGCGGICQFNGECECPCHVKPTTEETTDGHR